MPKVTNGTSAGNNVPLAILWRRKSIVAVTFLVFALTAAVVSKSLEKVYATEATLLISLPASTQTFDSVQASQAVARSYADIIKSPNIAGLVAARLGTTPKRVADAVSFEPVTETQLLKIKAQDPDPHQAKLIADTYANVFIDYAGRNLAQTTKARTSLADGAPLKTTPARPKPTLYTLLASLLGLALGVALAFLRDRLDRRLRTAEEVEATAELPLLARVPRRGRSDASQTAFREAFRLLRTNLQFAAPNGELRSLAVTSGHQGEGKTTTVANLAIAAAEVGLRVLVVEADLRRPSLQRELLPNRPEPLRPGLTNYFVETASLAEIIYPADRPNVDLVPAGPLPPSPPALLESRRGRGVVPDLLTQADLVIIDCPPLGIGADASIISGWVDGVIAVIDLDHSTDHSVRNALRQLETVNAPVLGLVLNRDRAATPASYDYYYQSTGTAVADMLPGHGGRGRATTTPPPVAPGAAGSREPR